MRRRGLRARIRQQRRLAKRMATRHSMARRQQAGVRMLEMLGAWDDEPTSALPRFVPPARPALATAAPAARGGESSVPADAFGDPVDDAEHIATVAAHPGPPRPAAAREAERETSTTDAPTHVRPNGEVGVQSAGTQVDARSSPRRVSDRPATQPRRVPPPPVSAVTPPAEPQPVSPSSASAKPEVRAERRSPGEREADLRGDRAAFPGEEIRAPSIDRPPASVDAPAEALDAAAAPDAPATNDAHPAGTVVEIASAEPVSRQPAAGEPAPEDSSPARAATEYDVVARAMAALRASGELPDAPRPTLSRVPSSPGQPPAQGAAQPPTGDLTRTAPNADDGQPLPVATHASGKDASAHAIAAPPTPERPASPSAPVEQANEPGPSVSGPRIDERRQARRPPVHVAGQRAGAVPADSPAAPSSQRPAPPVHERPERPAGEPDTTQFQFTDIGRTPQEWRQLLIEATTPQPPKSRARPSQPATPSSHAESPDAQRLTRREPPSRTVAPMSSPANALTDTSRAPRTAPPGRETHRPVSDPPIAPHPATRGHASSTVHPAPVTRPDVPRDDARSVPPPVPTIASDVAPVGESRDHDIRAQSSADDPSVTTPAGTLPEAGVEFETPTAADEAGPEDIETATATGGTRPSHPRGMPNVVTEASLPLVAATHAAPSIARRTTRPAPAPPPAPLSPSTRRFLRPLVGIDPDTVQVRRDDDAARLGAAHGADAVSIGDAVVLPADRDERDPATLALIAHELTHVARGRSHRFVPPVARGEWTVPDAGIPRASSVRGVDPERARAAPAPDDEELMARVVEARVREAATRERAVAVTTFVEADHSPSADDDIGGNAHVDDAANGVSATATPAPVRSARWGGLPAPWEPLPEFMTRARQSTTPPPAAPPSPSANHVTAGAGASTATVRLAERGLGSAGEEPAHAEPPALDGDGAPDIDVLARQVYAVLRRRLAAERRRGA